jgi:hypothetical protein
MRITAAAVLAIFGVMVAPPWASAWYGPATYLSPSTATRGATVTVRGVSFNYDDPVLVYFDGLDGPVVATFTPASGSFEGPLVVPADAKAGSHLLLFVQYDSEKNIEEMPIRAQLVTTAAGGTPLVAASAASLAVDTTPRPAALEQTGRQPIGIGELVLVALAAAALAALVVGIVVRRIRSGAARGSA